MHQIAYALGGTDVSASRYKYGAELFRSLAHPARLQILDELRRAQACVCHLQTVLRRPQAYVSQQLRVLREAELVTDDKDGLLVYYRLSNPRVERLLEEVLGPADGPTRLPNCPCPRCQAARGTEKRADGT
ncbi:MAG: helix-turn-helix transcriptional regulator [Anaerolineae bacterium]|nr:helix-turn-helix transcriptional regulator [Anaerolineae bacterium]